MEFIVSRNRLLRALQHTRCAITKGDLDVFKQFVLTFPDNPDDCTMTVHASNGDMWITETVLLDKLIPGTDDGTMHPVAIWYSDLLRCIKALDEQPLHFTVFEYQLSVQHSVGSFRLAGGGTTSILNRDDVNDSGEAVTDILIYNSVIGKAPVRITLPNFIKKAAASLSDDDKTTIYTALKPKMQEDFDAKGAAAQALTEAKAYAKAYTDSKVNNS